MTEDRAAWFKRLFDEHGSALERYLWRYLGNDADACELAQETLLRMWQVKDIGEIREPRSYMFTIARHLADARIADRGRERNSVDASDPAVEPDLPRHPDPVEEVVADQELKKLRRAFARLPRNVRTAYLLQVGHGLSYEEIARHLGVTPHAVKKYLQQVIPLLQKYTYEDENEVA
ncbi:MAG: RNA polymerase sigma factor [Proteobacteria bacterium]|nr:RNA polymerase sigma factor [Pseudomonadota bacterium]